MTFSDVSSKYDVSNKYSLSKQTCCFVGEECIASLKDAANRAAMKLRYARGVKEEQLEVVVAFLCGSDVFAVLLTGFRRSLLCMPAFNFRVARGD